MKILVITERLPSKIGGGAARQLNLIKHLAHRHEFTLASFSSPQDAHRIEEIRPYLKRVEVVWMPERQLPMHSRLYWQLNAWSHSLFAPYPRRGRFKEAQEMRDVVGRLHSRHHFDIVQIHQAYLAETLSSKITAKKVLDMHDVLSDYEHRAMATVSRPSHRFHAWMEWQKMRVYERRQVRKFDHCLTVSEVDRASLLELVPDAPVTIIPNGVDTDYYQPSGCPAKGNNLVFFGSMNFQPNVEGVLWFYRSVLPLVREQIPDIHFTIVGWQPPQEIIDLGADPAITVTGEVDDVRPYIDGAAVVVVPLHLGSGTRLKILDAWAMEKAVVSTSIGAEGLPAKPEENLLLADEAGSFAAAVVRLLRDDSLRDRLGQNGRELVLATFDWNIIVSRLDSIYTSLT
ncbi:MAG: glycosyltransferase [Candidatus Promineofilum sp.]|nr:glycosyltransferase [Promineifilum sp.]